MPFLAKDQVRLTTGPKGRGDEKILVSFDHRAAACTYLAVVSKKQDFLADLSQFATNTYGVLRLVGGMRAE